MPEDKNGDRTKISLVHDVVKPIIVSVSLGVAILSIVSSIMVKYGQIILNNFFDNQAQWFASIGIIVGSLSIIYALSSGDRKKLLSIAISVFENIFPFQSIISKSILSEVDAIKRREGETDGAAKASAFSAARARKGGADQSAEKESLRDALGADDLFEIFRNRMLKEILRLQWAANKNLLFAVLFCASGAWLLIISANEAIHSINSNFGKSVELTNVLPLLVATLIPRALVGVMISAVGYFFLKLYMSNEMDIKHTKNEITNIESRVIAYKIYESSLIIAKNSSAGTLKNISAINSVIESFANTERNFVIENGRGTSSRESASEILKSLDIVQAALDKFPSIPK